MARSAGRALARASHYFDLEEHGETDPDTNANPDAKPDQYQDHPASDRGALMSDVFLPKLLKPAEATYWAPATSDGFGGKIFAAPVQIAARWEEKTVLFMDKHGREAQSSAVVMVGADLNMEGYLLHGVSVAADPLQVGGAHEIQGWEKVPNFKGKRFVRKAFL